MSGDGHAGGISVSVVVPVYRNAATVDVLQGQLTRVLEACGLEFETIFVDDACPEGSGRRLHALAARDRRVRVVSHERNRGQHRAVVTGLEVATGEWIVIMDADLQDPPRAIPALLAAGRQGFSAVFAGRRGRYESRGRLLTSRMFKRALSHLCGVPPDAGSFVAVTRSVADRVLVTAHGRCSLPALIGMTGLPVTSIPIDRQSRSHGRSAYSSWGRLRSGTETLLRVVVWRLRGLPVKEGG
jgi:polyisoprenyl-phosphate glycosyltransferase